MQIKGIYVIIQNYKPLFAKKINIGSIFKFMKGFLANMLVIITLAALMQISPKFIEFSIKKVFSFINSNSFKPFKIFQNPLV